MDATETLAERLKSARLSAAISARRLSIVAGLSPSMVFHIEKGLIVDPGLKTINQIAQSLGVSLDWLVNGQSESPRGEEIAVAFARSQVRSRHQSEDAFAATGTEG